MGLARKKIKTETKCPKSWISIREQHFMYLKRVHLSSHDQGFVLESFRKTKIKSLKFIFQKIKSDKTLNSLIQTI